MATHPYISGAGNVAQMVNQLRKAFPAIVTSETVKKLGIAPNSESYVINTLQFVGVLDTEGKKTAAGGAALLKQKDEDFNKAFEALVKKAYADLFEIHAEGAWTLGNDDLITFFRESDKTSELIGRRQATTFRVLAALSGHGDAPVAKPAKSKPANGPPKKPQSGKTESSKVTQAPPAADPHTHSGGAASGKSLGLSVRIEINLPADGSKETYDNIFKSIKDNLLNG
jgi:Family of unknown function (DUF5343)